LPSTPQPPTSIRLSFWGPFFFRKSVFIHWCSIQVRPLILFCLPPPFSRLFFAAETFELFWVVRDFFPSPFPSTLLLYSSFLNDPDHRFEFPFRMACFCRNLAPPIFLFFFACPNLVARFFFLVLSSSSTWPLTLHENSRSLSVGVPTWSPHAVHPVRFSGLLCVR